MTDDEAKERAEDARVIARAQHGIGNGYMALNARARDRWPQAIADRDTAELRVWELEQAVANAEYQKVERVAELELKAADAEAALLMERVKCTRAQQAMAEQVTGYGIRTGEAEARLAEAVALLRRWRKLNPGTPPTGGGVWGKTDAFLARIDGEG